jgi:AcrR family transcriptional regulator
MNDRSKSGSVVAATAADTRRRLLDGTLLCLRERGLAGTTSREIARASGVNLGGITYHFGSKDELVAEALLEAIRDWLDPALRILRSDADPVSRMTGAVQALQASFEEARELLPVYLEALVHAPRTEVLRVAVTELFDQLRGFLAAQIGELVHAGFLPGWVDPMSMASLIIASADGLAVHAALNPGTVQRDAIAGQVVQLLLAARSGA